MVVNSLGKQTTWSASRGAGIKFSCTHKSYFAMQEALGLLGSNSLHRLLLTLDQSGQSPALRLGSYGMCMKKSYRKPTSMLVDLLDELKYVQRSLFLTINVIPSIQCRKMNYVPEHDGNIT